MWKVYLEIFSLGMKRILGDRVFGLGILIADDIDR